MLFDFSTLKSVSVVAAIDFGTLKSIAVATAIDFGTLKSIAVATAIDSDSGHGIRSTRLGARGLGGLPLEKETGLHIVVRPGVPRADTSQERSSAPTEQLSSEHMLVGMMSTVVENRQVDAGEEHVLCSCHMRMLE